MLTVVGGKKNDFESVCKVLTADKGFLFKEYVVIGCDDHSGEVTLVHNADAVTLGIALQLVKNHFTKAYEALPAEGRAEVDKLFEVTA